MVSAKTDQMGGLRTERSSLANRIAQWGGGSNVLETPIAGLKLQRWEAPTDPTSYMLPASICLIGQGKKRLYLGEETYVYDTHRFLITSIDLPVVTHIIEASHDKPYLGLTLELDLRAIAQLILTQNLQTSRPPAHHLGLAVSDVSAPLLNAFNRLIDLLETPGDISALAPLIKQEIFYRLLTGEQGARLRHIATDGNHGHQISRSIDWLKENFSKSVKVDELANRVGLSVSAFHSHFRSVTAMSPLQYQKRIRLNEARRMMLTEHIDAARAAFEVGYESPSQFSREYSRQFGAPPMRDIKSLI